MDGWGIDLAISNGGAEMHKRDTPSVRIGSLPLVIKRVKIVLKLSIVMAMHVM